MDHMWHSQDLHRGPIFMNLVMEIAVNTLSYKDGRVGRCDSHINSFHHLYTQGFSPSWCTDRLGFPQRRPIIGLGVKTFKYKYINLNMLPGADRRKITAHWCTAALCTLRLHENSVQRLQAQSVLWISSSSCTARPASSISITMSTLSMKNKTLFMYIKWIHVIFSITVLYFGYILPHIYLVEQTSCCCWDSVSAQDFQPNATI